MIQLATASIAARVAPTTAAVLVPLVLEIVVELLKTLQGCKKSPSEAKAQFGTADPPRVARGMVRRHTRRALRRHPELARYDESIQAGVFAELAQSSVADVEAAYAEVSTLE